MDINKLFRSGMRKCGRVLNILPKEDIGSPQEYMMKVLTEETIPSLNTVFPRLYHCTFSVTSLIELDSSDMASDARLSKIGMDSRYKGYRIPLSMTEGLKIMSIKRLSPTAIYDGCGSNVPGTYFNYATPNRWGRLSSANMYEAVSRAQLAYVDAMVMGPITDSFRYYFFGPNILFINDYTSNCTLSGVLCLENDPNLISVEDTAFDGVKDLFILDLKSSIYNEYAMFSEIDTPGGTVSLKIDDWASAESDRKDLYQQYLGTAHIRTSSMRTG